MATLRSATAQRFIASVTAGVFSNVGDGIISPTQLPSLSAWYDASDRLSMLNNSGATPASGDGIKLWGDKSGNSAVNAFVSGGAASNTATIANKSLTGSFTITADVTLLSYTAPASNVTLFDNVTGNSGFRLLLLTTGFLQITVGDGSALTTFSSSAAMTTTALTRVTIQAVYTDNTSVVFNVGGVALGTTVTVNKVLANGAAVTCFTNLNGVVYSLVVGALYSFQPSTAGKLATTVTDSVSGTWTINTSGDTGARICGARDLYQGTGTKQPILTIAAGANKLTFDGTSQYLKAGAFSLSQPETVYFTGTQETWTLGDAFFDGNSAGERGAIVQGLTTPKLIITAGSNAAENSGVVTTTRAVLTAVFSAAASILRVNRLTATTGNPGATSMNGFVVGANSSIASFSNITTNEVAIYSAAHLTPTQDQLALYLGRKWGVAV